MDFTVGAHHADLVVLGGGMHYFDNTHSARMYQRLLNHTLASLQHTRKMMHGHKPRSVYVLQPPKPITNCATYSKPISLGEAAAADVNDGLFSKQYQELPRIALATAATC